MQTFEDKQLSVLRRKFMVGIPLSAAFGYWIASRTAAGSQFSKWGGRGLKTLGFVGVPLVTSWLIVHFNRAEIFRIGTSMMREMGELRTREEGPFSDPSVREKWDSQMASRKFSNSLLSRTDCESSRESNISEVNFNQIVEDSLRK